MKKIIIALLLIVAVIGGYLALNKKKNATKRWYTQNQVTKGKVVFEKNCAVCHGLKAEKTVNWRTKLADGSYPPPPLNGTAHAWHHSFAQLMDQIKYGGARYGGKMPPFEDKLTKEEMKDAISYFQSFWSDKIYKTWKKRSGLN